MFNTAYDYLEDICCLRQDDEIQAAKGVFETLRKFLIENGVTPLFFHYHILVGRNQDKRLFATTCLLMNHDNIPIAKGLTVVSSLDNPRRFTGLAGALERALIALDDESSSDPIRRQEAKYITDYLKDDWYSAAWSNKSVFAPNQGELTNLEIGRLIRRQQRMEEKDKNI